MQNSEQRETVETATAIFKYLHELKKLQTKQITSTDSFDQVLWLSSLPHDKLCDTRAWDVLSGQRREEGAWVEIQRPRRESPPELPDRLGPLVKEETLEDSNLDSPTLLELTPVVLREYLNTASEEGIERSTVRLSEKTDIFDLYVEYVETEWIPWAKRRREHSESQEDPPPPREELHAWLSLSELSNFNLTEPSVKDNITVEIDRRLEIARDEALEEWSRYLEVEWKPWAMRDREQNRIQEAYNTLFSIYQKQQKLGEQFETVYSFGLLTWRAPKSGLVKRHIVTVPVSVNFDPRRGILSVGPGSVTRSAILEEDFLAIEDRPNPEIIDAIKSQIAELESNYFDQAAVFAILDSWTNSLSVKGGETEQVKGVFLKQMSPGGSPSPDPVISFAPAIILRKRSSRGILEFIKKVISNLESDTPSIPKGIKIFQNPVNSGYENFGEEESVEGVAKETEIYFPLAANKEQLQIIRHLDSGPGVLVQGPPGTGKSHTIANLICHLLAKGQRIIVTSETTRALQSLRSKFSGPAAAMADLAVVLLNHDEEGITALGRSVEAIRSKKLDWNSKSNQIEISNLEQELLNIRKEIQTATRKLREVREAETITYANKFGRYSGSLSKIAKELNETKIDSSWIRDDITEPFALEESEGSISDLLNRWKEHKPHLLPLVDITVGEGSYPIPETFIDKVKLLEALKQELGKELAVDQTIVESFRLASENTLTELRNRLAKYLANYRHLKNHIREWVPQMAKDVVAEQDRIWAEILNRSKNSHAELTTLLADFVSPEIEGLQNGHETRHLRHIITIIDFFRNGGSPSFLFLKPKPIKEAFSELRSLRIDGESIRDLRTAERYKRFLEINNCCDQLRKLWSSYVSLHADEKLLQATAGDLIEPLESAFQLLEEARAITSSLTSDYHIAPPRWYEEREIENYISCLDTIRAERIYGMLRHEFAAWSAAISQLPRIPFEDGASKLLTAISTNDVDLYREGYETIKSHALQYTEALNLLERIKQFRTALPKTYEYFVTTHDDPAWSTRFANLERITQWLAADKWITALCDKSEAARLGEYLQQLKARVQELIGKIAEHRAWGYCMDRLTEEQRQALTAWNHAVQKMGKGFSKYKERYRREAQEHLSKCQSAIPAWIMPFHRLVETVPAEPGTFDVAIIDEASQSGPEGLIVNYLAEKVIVVGDDQQIRPQYVGMNAEDVFSLINQHLKDKVPHHSSFDLNGSYFYQASLRLNRHVRLKEHFRCMPEIIQFSNRHMYSTDPLIPLRQYGSERLYPVCRTKFVEGGFRQGESGNTINPVEAEAIVKQICECCEDPGFDGKTFGVIVLLGKAQAQLIEQKLLKELSAKEFEKRNLLVGDPYTFQGDERDVIFLSMVDAPMNGRQCIAMTKQEYARSFNVAASRARDVMWLFHSAALEDLKPECLRYKLLAHCTDPGVSSSTVSGIQLEDLIRVARYSDRNHEDPPKPFDSWFEIDVCTAIAARGYRVLPQYIVNENDRRYRIDLVVEGITGRIAVECDGDKWHGIEQFDYDDARQAELQRCGWRFWRVRGSEYYRNPEKALEPLWQLLERENIRASSIKPAEPTNDPRQTESNNPEEGEREAAYRDVLKQSESSNSKSHAVDEDDDENVLQDGQLRRTTSSVSASEIQEAILSVLKERPGNSVMMKAITKEVLKNLGIHTRAGPRLEFEKRVKRSIGVLKRKDYIEEYKAKNIRIRLKLDPDTILRSLESLVPRPGSSIYDTSEN